MRAAVWARWVLANALGGFLGAAVGGAEEAVTFGLTVGPLVGLGLGLGQWRGLRRDLVRDEELSGVGTAVNWVTVTAVGALIPGYLLVFALVLGATNGGKSPADPGANLRDVALACALFAAVPGVASGAVVGLLQGVSLRGIRPAMPIRQVLAWGLATAGGWGAGWGLTGGALLSPAARGVATPPLAAIAMLLPFLGWALAAAPTGAVLARLPRTPWPYA